MKHKNLDERLQECKRLRAQWNQQVTMQLPEEIVRAMNRYVANGEASSGALPFWGKTLAYQFSAASGRETYLKISS